MSIPIILLRSTSGEIPVKYPPYPQSSNAPIPICKNSVKALILIWQIRQISLSQMQVACSSSDNLLCRFFPNLIFNTFLDSFWVNNPTVHIAGIDLCTNPCQIKLQGMRNPTGCIQYNTMRRNKVNTPLIFKGTAPP